MPTGLAGLNAELQELMQQEINKVIEVNAIFGALQQAKRVHAEVSRMSSVTELRFIGTSGGQATLDLTEFERDARKHLEERERSVPVDADMIPKNQDLYG